MGRKANVLNKDFFLKSRFIDSSGCWIWTGRRNQGRAVVSKNANLAYVSRLAFELWKEPIKKGMCICHKCDNPLCFNPDHLFQGTYRDNMQDMIAKGRCGKRSLNRAKITEEDANQIKKLYRNGNISQRALGRKFGIVQPQIWKIVNELSWNRK